MSEAPTTPTTEPAPGTATPPEATATSAADALFPDGGAQTDPQDPSPDAPVEEVAAVPAEADAAPVVEATPEPAPEPTGDDTASAPEYNFTLPEGFVTDDALTTRAKEVFANAGVPADKAQALIDLFADTLSAQRTEAESAYATQQTEWLAAIDQIPEFQGPTKEKSLATIGRLFDTYGSEDAKAALNIGGVGNNPHLAKFILNVAKALDEGAPTGQGRPAAVDRNGRALRGRTAGEILFGGTPSENTIMTGNT